MSQNPKPLLRKEFHHLDAQACERIAAATARLVLQALRQDRHNKTAVQIALRGELGAGKTTWVRACGIRDRIKSPSFSVVESYEIDLEGANLPIHHIDFYRQTSPADWSSAGLRDLFAQRAVVLIEWPQRAAGLPAAHIALELAWEDDVSGDAPRCLTIEFFNRPEGLSFDGLLPQWITDVDKS
jgi:tRNA threonylcarbamoyladenosine biosynthesis protein TsaE